MDSDRHSANTLLPIVYQELRRLSASYLRRERPGQTLQATALVHEAYLRLVDHDAARRWDSRGHFFAAAAEAMRRILVEHARKRARVKRGGNPIRTSLSDVNLATEQDPEAILALDAAIRRLREQDPTAADVVQLRFFAGLSVEETARTLDLSERTVKREWAFARAWLYEALGGTQR